MSRLSYRGVIGVLAAVVGLTAYSAYAQTGIVQITSGPTVAETEITDSSAVVRWQTNVESTTIVNFGTTSALGQEYKKIVPMEETEITEISHNMALWGLQPGTEYYYQVRSSANGLTAQSAILQFRTKATACSEDIWECAVWGTCTKGTDGMYAQSRACTLTTDCPTATTPKPAESQTCTPACIADTWNCVDWSVCSAAGQQTRACTLATDCPTATTPKPAESQTCAPACIADTWNCAEWGSCSSTGRQTRICTLAADCPTATTPKPAESQTCAPACTEDKWTCTEWSDCDTATSLKQRKCTLADDCPSVTTPKPAELEECFPQATLLAEAQEMQHSREQAEELAKLPEEPEREDVDGGAPAPSVQDFEKNTENVSGGFGLMGAPAVPVTVLRDECAASGILPERCAAWLEAKYADDSCEQAGIFTKEACERYLSDKAGGVFPGCAGMTVEACDEIKARATLGYLPEAEKIKVDEIITTKKVSEAFAELGDAAPQLIAVRDTKQDEVRWWPSAKTEGADTSPGFIIFDVDKDGVPDDLERLRGMDTASADSDNDGVSDSDELKAGTDPNGSDKPFSPLSPVEKAFLANQPIGQPIGSGETDPTFTLALGEPSNENARPSGAGAFKCEDSKQCPPEYPQCYNGYCFGDGYDVNGPPPGTGSAGTSGAFDPAAWNKLSGRALPNTTVLLYVYSYVPMVLSTTTDANGDFTYDLADNVVDGEHSVYVAITDDTGKITKKSEPLAFFVKGAIAATSEADFLRADVNVVPDQSVADYARYYLYGAAALVLLALGFAWRFTRGIGRGADVPKGPPSAT